jgi:hypothetical protein
MRKLAFAATSGIMRMRIQDVTDAIAEEPMDIRARIFGKIRDIGEMYKSGQR